MPPSELKECKRILKYALNEADDLKSQYEANVIDSDALRAACAALGQAMVAEICLCLSQTVFLEEGWCVLHEKMCPLSPRAHSEFMGHFWLEIVGNTCCPWSPLNVNTRKVGSLLDAATLDMLIWAFSTRYYEPDAVLQENVKDFDSTLLLDIFTDGSDTIPKSVHSRPSSGEARPFNCLVCSVFPRNLSFSTS